MKRIIGVITLIAAVSLNSSVYAFSDIIVFGDSLSDVGNIYNLTLENPIIAETVGVTPDIPYWYGRFSNGPVWVEYVSYELGLYSDIPNASIPFEHGGINYAHGGAETDFDLKSNWFEPDFADLFGFGDNGIRSQVAVHVIYGTTSPNDLIVIWGGGNDLMNGEVNTREMAINIGGLIAFMHQQVGATYFLVPNLPPLGQIPKYKGGVYEDWMNSLTSQYNNYLGTVLDWVEATYPVTIYRPDLHGLFLNMLSDPAAYGFSNIDNPAYDKENDVVNVNVDSFLFWDEIHPTTKGHEIIAQEALKLIK